MLVSCNVTTQLKKFAARFFRDFPKIPRVTIKHLPTAVSELNDKLLSLTLPVPITDEETFIKALKAFIKPFDKPQEI